MDLPEKNPGGYINASITNVTGFRDTDFLLAHGSADDNVHFSNSAHLLDMFTSNHIRKFRFRMFTDRCAAGYIFMTYLLNFSEVIIASTAGARSGRSMSILLHFW